MTETETSAARVFVKRDGTWTAESDVWPTLPGNITQLRHFMRNAPVVRDVPDTEKDIFIGDPAIIRQNTLKDEVLQAHLESRTIRSDNRDWAARKMIMDADGMFRPAGPIRSDKAEVCKHEGDEQPPESFIIEGRDNARRQKLAPWDINELRGRVVAWPAGGRKH